MEDFAGRAATSRLTDHRIPKLEGDITLARANRFKRSRQYQDAAAILSEGLALEPRAALHIARGDAYQSLNRQVAAVRDFTRALTLLPQNEGALVERAWSYRRLGRTEAALADLDLAVRLDPLNPRQLRLRASLNWRLKRPAAALRDLDAAMEFGEWDAWTLDLRGRVHLSHTKDYAKAVVDFRRATELAPKAPRHWYNLAVAYLRMKDCNTVTATLHYLELCAKGGTCRKKSMRTAQRVLAGFVNSHAACRAQLPRPPTPWQRIWARFKSGLAKTIALLFFEPKAQ
jgi:tetratricopeptide (TPR) repeat protein